MSHQPVVSNRWICWIYRANRSAAAPAASAVDGPWIEGCNTQGDPWNYYLPRLLHRMACEWSFDWMPVDFLFYYFITSPNGETRRWKFVIRWDNSIDMSEGSNGPLADGGGCDWIKGSLPVPVDEEMWKYGGWTCGTFSEIKSHPTKLLAF